MIPISALTFHTAEPGFYTDFCTTPPEFAEASEAATINDGYDTLLQLLAGESEPLFVVVDGCTLGVTPSSSSDRYILLSKASQGCVKHGDTAECTRGRLSLKNSGSYIALPEVTGPCNLTYYAASSSETDLARGFECIINGTSTPEAGASELKYREDTVQATVRIRYNCLIEGPVTIKLIARGSVYLYDIEVVPYTKTITKNRTMDNHITLWTKDNTLINSDRLNVEIFSLSGQKVITSDMEYISLTDLSKGIYLVRSPSIRGWRSFQLFR